jgi:DNA-binding PadR family transcriptional regulator
MSRRAPKGHSGKSLLLVSSFLATFTKVRILGYAAKHAVRRDELMERLHRQGCKIPTETLNRTLRQMVRHQWLRPNGNPHTLRNPACRYTLTGKGRKALALARKQVGSLAEKLHIS